MDWVPYASFALGLYIGAEIGFRLGQKYAWSQVVAACLEEANKLKTTNPGRADPVVTNPSSAEREGSDGV